MPDKYGNKTFREHMLSLQAEELPHIQNPVYRGERFTMYFNANELTRIRSYRMQYARAKHIVGLTDGKFIKILILAIIDKAIDFDKLLDLKIAHKVENIAAKAEVQAKKEYEETKPIAEKTKIDFAAIQKITDSEMKKAVMQRYKDNMTVSGDELNLPLPPGCPDVNDFEEFYEEVEASKPKPEEDFEAYKARLFAEAEAEAAKNIEPIDKMINEYPGEK